jgi:hypothetical protein
MFTQFHLGIYLKDKKAAANTTATVAAVPHIFQRLGGAGGARGGGEESRIEVARWSLQPL